MTILSKLFQYVLLATSKHGIDDTHGLSHSMVVLQYADQIYQSEQQQYPYLIKQQNIIYISAVLHDMCDKKYMDEKKGLDEIEEFLLQAQAHKPLSKDYAAEIGTYADLLSAKKQIGPTGSNNPIVSPNEIAIIKQIMHTMSYSKVKKNGYPTLGGYQRAYHVVREADLLAAYDFDRSMMYHMVHNNKDMVTAFDNAEELFKTRVLRHNEDGLFETNFAKNASIKLHAQAIARMNAWRRLVYPTH